MTINKANKNSKPFALNGCKVYGVGTMTVNRKWGGESFVTSRTVLAILLGETSKSGRITKSLVPLARAFKDCTDATLAEAWEKYTNYSVVPSPGADVRTAELLVNLSTKYTALPILANEAEAIEAKLAVYGDFAKWREAVKGESPKAKMTPVERFNALAKALGDDFGSLARAWVKAHATSDEAEKSKAEAEALAKASKDKLVLDLRKSLAQFEAEAEKAKAEADKERAKIASVFAEKAKLEGVTREALKAKAKAEAELNKAVIKVKSLEAKLAKVKGRK